MADIRLLALICSGQVCKIQCKMNLRLLTCILFCSIACSVEKKTNQIYIEISPEKLTLDGKDIHKDDFEKELKLIIDEKKADGIKREQLVVNLKVDSRTRRGDIADIETALRRLNVRRVNYSTFGKEQTSANIVYAPCSSL